MQIEAPDEVDSRAACPLVVLMQCNENVHRLSFTVMCRIDV